MKWFLRCLVIIGLMASSAWAAGPNLTSTSTLTWDANVEPDLAGYRLYYSATSGGQTIPGTPSATEVAPSTTHLIGPITSGQYYAKITAYDQSGNESVESTEVPFVMEPLIPPPPILLHDPFSPFGISYHIRKGCHYVTC